MCGIAGFYSHSKQAEAATVQLMCDQIRHRGPDDAGYYVENGCAIGMRRLSIIDLKSGHQPISNEDGSVWVVFNGEIYNYRELRFELASQGHRFTTHTDTEVLVHLYEEKGVESLARLRGMFALALWDSRRRKILLARDRFGKKPLYYSAGPGGLWFSSELKCLKAAGLPLTVNEEALRLYFQFRYIPDPFTPYQDIWKLSPGSWLTYDIHGFVRQGRYWRMPPFSETGATNLSEDDAIARVRDLMDESVRIRMIADVPLGAFLSGGIDSSSVVASMALQSPSPVKTFSIGFAESGFNELPYASVLARKYATDHHEILVRPDSVALVERLVQHFDEPFGDASAIPTFVMSEFAAQHVKVALSGDGGDELFGGYDSFVAVEKMKKLDRIPAAARTFLSILADKLPYSAYGKNYLRMISRPSALERYFEHIYTPHYLRERLLDPMWMLPADESHIRRQMSDCLLGDGASTLSQAMYFEATANLTGDMLVKVDRMSMANSLEVRCPLLDHVLAEFAAGLPHSWRIHNGKGKRILIRAMAERLPRELLNRKKMGFGVPLGSWFRGPLRELLHDHLTGSRFLSRGIASPDFVRALIKEHESGRRNNQLWLWALLMLELWFRGFEEYRTPERALGALR